METRPHYSAPVCPLAKLHTGEVGGSNPPAPASSATLDTGGRRFKCGRPYRTELYAGAAIGLAEARSTSSRAAARIAVAERSNVRLTTERRP